MLFRSSLTRATTTHLTHRTMSSKAAATGSYTPTPLTRVVWGAGTLSQLPDILASLPRPSTLTTPPPPPRALIITGNSLATKTDVIKRAEAALGDAHAGTFSKISQHAPVEAIREAVHAVRTGGATALIAIGGGSPIDAAKAVSFYMHREGEVESDDPLSFIPIIAVPTTLSAAECTQNAGFTENGRKTGVSHPALAPRALVLDAECTLDTPEKLWLSTGMRAVDHAIECLYRPGPSALLRGNYLYALRELFELLPLSKKGPSNVDVRQRLQIAAIVSLWPESRKGALGLSHGLGHALGATYSIGHGITSCLTLPGAIRLTAKSSATSLEQLLALADARAYIPAPFATPVPLRPSVSTLAQGASDEDIQQARQAGLEVGDAVEKLVDALGLHSRLKPLGVPREDLEAIAAHASGKDEELKKSVVKLLENIWED